MEKEYSKPAATETKHEIALASQDSPRKAILFSDFMPREPLPGFIPGGSYKVGVYPALDSELKSLREDGLLPKGRNEDISDE